MRGRSLALENEGRGFAPRKGCASRDIGPSRSKGCPPVAIEGAHVRRPRFLADGLARACSSLNVARAVGASGTRRGLTVPSCFAFLLDFRRSRGTVHSARSQFTLSHFAWSSSPDRTPVSSNSAARSSPRGPLVEREPEQPDLVGSQIAVASPLDHAPRSCRRNPQVRGLFVL